jgi:glycosyltransferase involved in cell wall biosynthesis
MARFVIELATRYANLTDQVFAPSQSVATLLRGRGVRRPIAVVPTGVDLAWFGRGDGRRVRAELGIADDAFLVGYVGRLAPEKNLGFLAEVLARLLTAEPRVHALIAGKGPEENAIRQRLGEFAAQGRLHMPGVYDYSRLPDLYHALDVFAFSSLSETQGMVLTEALAAGVPAVALDASGVREVVRDGHNGRLLHERAPEAFVAALRALMALPLAERRRLQLGARQTAAEFSSEITAQRALEHYAALRRQAYVDRTPEIEQWERTLDLIKAEWEIVKGVAGAAGAAFGSESAM